MHSVLKAWVILQKKNSPIIYVPICGSLCQEHAFDQVKIKITIKFENWLRYCDESQTLRNPSDYVTIISEGQTTKVRKHFKNTSPKVKGNVAKQHEFRWIPL